MVDWVHCSDCKKPVDTFGLDKELHNTCIPCANSLREFFVSDAPEEIVVTPEQFEAFQACLDAPIEENTKLKELLTAPNTAIKHGCFIESDPYAQAIQEYQEPWSCPHCGGTQTWFDRMVQVTVVDGKAIEEGMFTRCIGCGSVVD